MTYHVSFEETKKDCISLIREITVNDRWLPDVIFSPSQGTLLGVMLSHYYDVPFINFTWRDNNRKSIDAQYLGAMAAEYLDQDILLVTDAYDTHSPIQEMVAVMKNMGHQFIRVAALWYTPDSNNPDLVKYYVHEKSPDFTQETIEFCYEKWWQ